MTFQVEESGFSVIIAAYPHCAIPPYFTSPLMSSQIANCRISLAICDEAAIQMGSELQPSWHEHTGDGTPVVPTSESAICETPCLARA